MRKVHFAHCPKLVEYWESKQWDRGSKKLRETAFINNTRYSGPCSARYSGACIYSRADAGKHLEKTN